MGTSEHTAIREPAVPAGSLVRRVRLGARRQANWVQLLKFGVVGGSGYAVNLAVFAVLSGPVGVHHIAAALGAFCVAVINNFAWNRHWTFGARDGHAGREAESARTKPTGAAVQAARFFAVSICGLGLNLVLLELFVSGLELPALASQALAVGLTMPVNFIGNKLWTFAR